MTQRQKFARAAPPRPVADDFGWTADYLFKWRPGVLIADGATAQVQAWNAVFVDDSAGYAATVDDALTDWLLNKNGTARPLEAHQDTVHMRDAMRIHCQFHMVYKLHHGELIKDKALVVPFRADIGRIAKQLGFACLKQIAIDALIAKMRSKGEDGAVAWLEGWRNKIFTYVEANDSAAAGGGIPNTNVSQEAVNKCAHSPPA